MNKLIDIKHLYAGYNNNPNVLEDISLTIFSNDFLGIIGPNGGGKTTLIKTILGLIKKEKGDIIFFKNNKIVDNIKIGYLPQINNIDKEFPINVFEVILLGLSPKGRLIKRYTSEDKSLVVDIANKIGIFNLLNRSISELSGGELQRVLLARAIVENPDIIIMDEPNTYVDKVFEKEFYKLIKEINKTTPIIIVSHDILTITPLVKNIACVNKTLHYHSGNNIKPAWLEHSYGSCPIDVMINNNNLGTI